MISSVVTTMSVTKSRLMTVAPIFSKFGMVRLPVARVGAAPVRSLMLRVYAKQKANGMTRMVCGLPMCCLRGDAVLTNARLSIEQTPWRGDDDGSRHGCHERSCDYAPGWRSVEQGAGAV